MTKEQRAETYENEAHLADPDGVDSSLYKAYLAGFTQAVELCAETLEASGNVWRISELVGRIKALASEKGEK